MPTTRIDASASFPVKLIVTHILEETPPPRIRPKSGHLSKSPTAIRRDVLDSWSVQMNQVWRWSELVNNRNVEIDGVSRLKVYKDRFDFEYAEVTMS